MSKPQCSSFLISFRDSEVMQELPVAFDELWPNFKETLTAVARMFGTYHRLGRLKDICIDNNKAIPEAHRLMQH